jgi:hypothetical protein
MLLGQCIVTRLVTVDGYWIYNWIYYSRTLKYNTTESLRTPSVLQLTTEYIVSQQFRSHRNRCNPGNRRTPGSLPSFPWSPTHSTANSPTTPSSPKTTPTLWIPTQSNYSPRYMTSGRTVEETVLLALVV